MSVILVDCLVCVLVAIEIFLLRGWNWEAQERKGELLTSKRIRSYLKCKLEDSWVVAGVFYGVSTEVAGGNSTNVVGDPSGEACVVWSYHSAYS